MTVNLSYDDLRQAVLAGLAVMGDRGRRLDRKNNDVIECLAEWNMASIGPNSIDVSFDYAGWPS